METNARCTRMYDALGHRRRYLLYCNSGRVTIVMKDGGWIDQRTVSVKNNNYPSINVW